MSQDLTKKIEEDIKRNQNRNQIENQSEKSKEIHSNINSKFFTPPKGYTPHISDISEETYNWICNELSKINYSENGSFEALKLIIMPSLARYIRLSEPIMINHEWAHNNGFKFVRGILSRLNIIMDEYYPDQYGYLVVPEDKLLIKK